MYINDSKKYLSGRLCVDGADRRVDMERTYQKIYLIAQQAA